MNSSFTINISRNIARFALSGLLFSSLFACGGGGGSAGTNPLAPTTTLPVGSVSLIFSSSELKSSGATGSEVTVTALVKSETNNALPGIPVTISTNSGVIAPTGLVSDTNGQAKASLSISGDHANRTIMVTAQAGTKTYVSSVSVVGTTVDMVGPASIPLGGTGDITITVKDSASVVVANVPISFTSKLGNSFVVKTSGGGTSTAPLTNAQGQVVLTMAGANSGADVITVSSQNSTVVNNVVINAALLTVGVVDPATNIAISQTSTSSCQKIVARYLISGAPPAALPAITGNISASRGQLYSDAACAVSLGSAPLPVNGGNLPDTYLKSNTAGVATITASITGGPTAQTNIEFVAALTSSATISLQAEPAVIGTNIGSSTTENTTLTAIVRDGTANNNFVKGAVVVFSVVSDKSGGSLSNPSVKTTASNGTASVQFFSGAADTPTDGVVISAKIQGQSTSTTASLTVSRKSLFVTAGTGNQILTPSDTTYQMNFTAFVTDASGNPVPNATVTTSAIPTQYRKGMWVANTSLAAGAAVWIQAVTGTCANEDGIVPGTLPNGILDPGEDFNNNGILDPRIPLSVTSSVVTDAFGTAVFSVRYPRDRAYWTEIKLTFRASVSGTESTYITQPFWAPGLAADYGSLANTPPGYISPYGVNSCNLAN